MEKIVKESIEELDDARDVENMRKVEASLFIAGRFMALKELVSLTDINPILLRRILENLEERYKDSAIEIIRKEDSWKMDVSQEYAWLVNKLATGSAEFTKAEQETLAIIAYKHPIKQSVVIKIRGNKAYDHIKNFVDRGLVTRKKTGHTWELGVSDNFYDYFHLNREGG
jgi:segregation and condensation protein B